MILSRLPLLAAVMALLAGCLGDDSAEAPPPMALNVDANGYFCGMVIAEHPGPKAQIHLIGEAQPVWFSAVRDMFGFMMLPGEARDVTAVYVTDMSKAASWEDNNNGPWMDPKEAFFVIHSTRKGGMGTLEAVPFSVAADASAFAKQYGGQVVRYDDITPDYVFDTVTLEQ